MSNPTFSSITDELCSCGYLEGQATDPDSPIVFSPETNEYHFEYKAPNAEGKGMLVIYHCPFCGGAAPESTRDQLFAQITAEEENRLNECLEGIITIEDAINKLGPPDHDDPRGVGIKAPEEDGSAPNIQSFRCLTYNNLSDSADVYITDYLRDRVHITYQGKCLKSNPEI